MNTNTIEFWSEKTLLSLALLKLALLAVFFMSFLHVQTNEANAENGSACAGNNLVLKLEKDNPELYSQIVSEADAVKNGKSVFWKVEKNGVTSYLFGTMHMADPDISTLSDEVRLAISATGTVVIETTDILDPGASAKAIGQLKHLTLLAQDETLTSLVRTDLKDELETAVTSRGIPMQIAERMQPWLIATTVSLPVCELVRKQAGSQVLDQVIAAYATSNGKVLKGLETISEQFTAIASLPLEYHVSALEETLASGNTAIDMIETLKVLYREGQTGMVFPLMKAVAPKSYSGKGAAEFQEALVEKRNHTMLERVLPILEAGETFIAVGALHLPGNTGLVSLLRKHGYQVTSLR